MNNVTSVKSYLAVMLWSEINHTAQRQKLKARPEIASAALVSEQNTAFQFNSGREVLRSQEHTETDALWNTLGEVSRNMGSYLKRGQRRKETKGKVEEVKTWCSRCFKQIRQGLPMGQATANEAAWRMSWAFYQRDLKG